MIVPYQGTWPSIHETAFVAPSADVVGSVEIGSHSSVWFQVVIRGDVNHVHVGARTNIQDHSTLHVTRKTHPLRIGDEVTVGHRVMLHGCTLGNRVLVGMGAIVMDGAEIGDECIIGAGALVTQGTKVPPRSVVMGSPARVTRTVTDAELRFFPKSAANYVESAVEYYKQVPGASRIGVSHADLERMDHFRDSYEGHYEDGGDEGT